MKVRLLTLILALGLLGVPAAPALAANDTGTSLSAVVLVDEADLASLLASEVLGEYSLLGPVDIDQAEAALTMRGVFDENSLLTPTELGIDTPNNWWGPWARWGGGGWWGPWGRWGGGSSWCCGSSWWGGGSWWRPWVAPVVVYRPFVPFPRFFGPVAVVIIRR